MVLIPILDSPQHVPVMYDPASTPYLLWAFPGILVVIVVGMSLLAGVLRVRD